MSKFSATLLMIAALLAFIVQGMANAVMACEAHMQGHDMHTAMMQHHHEAAAPELTGTSVQLKHDHGKMSHTQQQMDCCDDDSDCVCLTHACGSAQLLPVAEFSLTTDLVFLAAIWHEDQLPVAVAQSLYRPPIFA
ncbi:MULTISPECIES: hypothetical protein [unclassified Pseudoalteromonas]|uniref:hypothetical protein n=1 Tax=unclassified Pseudoalteromonas TaxID=194690 RepID=UPI002097648B|nr:hypothetical protein [Pseudoalteromonas sp. XMcav2-N]MCO7188137.1 hypothetical protein [Pseudoalteromonas sp. XMcav2-N]